MASDDPVAEILEKLDRIADSAEDAKRIEEEVGRLRGSVKESHQRIDSLEKTIRDTLTGALRGPDALPWYKDTPWKYILYGAALVVVLILSQFELIDLDRMDVWWDRLTGTHVGIVE